MKNVVRITVRRSSGYGLADEAFSDKLVIDSHSVKYRYKPVVESITNMPRQWVYRSNSTLFQELFKEAAAAVEEILQLEEDTLVTDIGVTTFIVRYDDETKKKRDFYLTADQFRDFYAIIGKMVPACENDFAVIPLTDSYE